jgi:hypothetical protein
MKKYLILLSTIAIVGISYFLFWGSKSDIATNDLSRPNDTSDSQTLNSAIDSRKKSSSLPFNENNLPPEEQEEIFKKSPAEKRQLGMMATKFITDQNKDIYKRVLEVCGNSIAGNAMASWIAYGTIMSGEPDYGYELSLKMTLINEHPEESMTLLNNSYQKFNGDDYFIKQMLLNIANQVDVSKEDKIKFYSESATSSLQLKDSTTMTNDDMNVTIAMYLLKENIKTEDEVLPFASALLEKNKNNPNALKLIKERLDGNFPGIKTELVKEYAQYNL